MDHDANNQHYAEYLQLEGEVLFLVSEVERLVEPLTTLDPLARRARTSLAAARSTVGKANAATLGLLPIDDTNWCLESSHRDLVAVRLALLG